MASATRIPPVIETVKTVVAEERFVLELSQEEAFALYAVLHRVGGDPNRSARGLIASISTAISGSGWATPAYTDFRRKNRFESLSAVLRFRDTA